MPLSYIKTNGDGSTQNFAVPFQYLDKSHVHVIINGAETLSFTWPTAATIQITPAPPVGVENVELRRNTPRDTAIVDYSNGSVLFDTDLDKSTLQALFIAQEYFEQPSFAISSGHSIDSHLDATPGEAVVKGALRVYNDQSKLKAIVATDGGILAGDDVDPKGVVFVPKGAHGQTLECDNFSIGNMSWKQGLRSLLQSAGDLLVATASGIAARLGVGATNQVLVADDTQSQKMKWSSTLAGLTLSSPVITSPSISGPSLSGTVTGVYTLAGTPSFSSPTLNSPTITGTSLIATGCTIQSPTITGNTVGLNAIKTATGGATGTLTNSAGTISFVNITTNDYAFPPNVRQTSAANSGTMTRADFATHLNAGDFIPRYHIEAFGASGPWTVGYSVQWRYFTASDNPVMWMAYNEDGVLMGVWVSDDPIPGNQPGLSMAGVHITQMTAKHLERLDVLSSCASEAEAYIKDRGLRMQHQAYRSLQLMTGEQAPAQWLLDNCHITDGQLTLRGNASRMNA